MLLEPTKPVRKEGQSTIRTFVSCPIVEYNVADPKQKQGLDSLTMFVAGDLLWKASISLN